MVNNIFPIGMGTFRIDLNNKQESLKTVIIFIFIFLLGFFAGYFTNSFAKGEEINKNTNSTYIVNR